MTLLDIIVWLMQRSVVFVGLTFTLIVVTTYWPGRRRTIEDHGLIPFKDEPLAHGPSSEAH